MVGSTDGLLRVISVAAPMLDKKGQPVLAICQNELPKRSFMRFSSRPNCGFS